MKMEHHLWQSFGKHNREFCLNLRKRKLGKPIPKLTQQMNQNPQYCKIATGRKRAWEVVEIYLSELEIGQLGYI